MLPFVVEHKDMIVRVVLLDAKSIQVIMKNKNCYSQHWIAGLQHAYSFYRINNHAYMSIGCFVADNWNYFTGSEVHV